MKKDKKYLDEFFTEERASRAVPPLEKFWSNDTQPVKSIENFSPDEKIPRKTFSQGAKIMISIFSATMVGLVGWLSYPTDEATTKIKTKEKISSAKVISGPKEINTQKENFSQSKQKQNFFATQNMTHEENSLEKFSSSESENPEEKFSVTGKDIRPVKMIELSPDQLSKLGLYISEKKNELTYFGIESISPKQYEELTPMQKMGMNAIGVNENNLEWIQKHKIVMNGVSIGAASDEEKKLFRITDIIPVVGSNYRNGKLMCMMWMSRDSIVAQQVHDQAKILSSLSSISNLIPVHTVLRDEEYERFPETDVILWYKASPEFFEKLPENYKAELTKEYFELVNNPAAIRGEESFFDSQRSSSGKILSSSVSPNPVSGNELSIRFNLSEERTVIVTLHDIFGKKILELSAPQNFSSGEQILSGIKIPDLANGMYLVSIQTEYGEQAVQRIILDR